MKRLLINEDEKKQILRLYEVGDYLSKQLHESESHQFTLDVESKQYLGYKYKVFNYSFEIDDVEYLCAVYPNLWKFGSGYYDVSFVTKGGSTNYRVGKDLNFMNSVLKTIGDCLIDFINRTDFVKIIAFEGDRVRERAYVRFFKNHPYFSKFKIDDTHKYTGFVEIHINKGVDM